MRPLAASSLAATALAAFLAFSPPAAAQVIDVSTIKCQDFLASGRDNIAAVMMWLSGYYANENDETTINFDTLKVTGEKLGKYCAENPSIGLLNAAEKVIEGN